MSDDAKDHQAGHAQRCFTISTLLISVSVGQTLLLCFGDRVYQVSGWTILGNWFALPGAFLTFLAILFGANRIFHIEI